jgi:AAA domain
MSAEFDGGIPFGLPPIRPERQRFVADPLEQRPPLAVVADCAAQPDGPVFIDLRDVQMRDVDWIDRPFLPAGELVTNNADGDTGKGLLAVHFAARISRGEFGDPRMCVFAVAEDAFETVLKPRLVAAGANLAYVRALGWRRAGTEDALLIPNDVPLLEQSIAGMGVRLLVVDPLLSHLSGKTNSHKDHEVKIALKPLMGLAHRIGCCVLGNGHFSKDRTGGARHASSGSTAFTNTPRLGLAMAYDDDPDVRVVEVIKSNIGPKHVGRNYRIRTVEVAGLEEPIPILVAEGAATKAVDDLIAVQKKGKRIPSELLQTLVLAELENGEQPRKALDAAAKEKLGANPDTVYKNGLNPLNEAGRIKARKDGTDGGWYWRLSLEEQIG